MLFDMSESYYLSVIFFSNVFLFSEEKQETICPFSSKIHGSWLLIDRHHKEHVTINQSIISFSHFGSFVCKERSLFSENLYKTVSYFSNGW